MHAAAPRQPGAPCWDDAARVLHAAHVPQVARLLQAAPTPPPPAAAGKPIASLAFHVCADVLAIGCGHKLYMWEYAAHGKLPVIGARSRQPRGGPGGSRRGCQVAPPHRQVAAPCGAATPPRGASRHSQRRFSAAAAPACCVCAACSGDAAAAPQRAQLGPPRARPASPTYYVAVLKTRRSMRAVHFHPHGLPLVLTAEVQDPSPTPELPATLTENGPYVLRAEQAAGGEGGSEEKEEEEAEQRAAARRSSGGIGAGGLGAAPPSVDVPIPSAQLLQGAAGSSSGSGQQPSARGPAAAAGVYVATSEGPVPVGRQQQQAAGLDLPAAALALAAPLHQLRLGGGGEAAAAAAAAGAAAAGPGSSDARQQAAAAGPPGRPGAPGWVPPGSAQLPPSMVPTGWELPFPASLFAGGEQPAGGGSGQGDAASSSWAATAASLPQVMAAFSAAAWNIIGQEQPPRVRLRLWRCASAGAAAAAGASAKLPPPLLWPEWLCCTFWALAAARRATPCMAGRPALTTCLCAAALCCAGLMSPSPRRCWR